MLTALLVFAAAGSATVFGTHAVCDRVRLRLRLAWHRRLTRKHGRMLQRPLGGAR